MKKLCMAALCAVSLSHAATPPPTTWKLATGYRAESFHTQNIMQFSRDVEQATRGKLVIQVHPNNTLAKLNDIRQAVADGKAQAGETIMTSLVQGDTDRRRRCRALCGGFIQGRSAPVEAATPRY